MLRSTGVHLHQALGECLGDALDMSVAMVRLLPTAIGPSRFAWSVEPLPYAFSPRPPSINRSSRGPVQSIAGSASTAARIWSISVSVPA